MTDGRQSAAESLWRRLVRVVRRKMDWVLAFLPVRGRLGTMSKRKSKVISEQLREAIEASRYSRYAIWKATGIDQSVLSRFMAGKFNLSLSNIDRLAAFLGLRLVQDRRRHAKGG